MVTRDQLAPRDPSETHLEGDGLTAQAGGHPGGELSVSVDLKNTGYAAPYNARPVYVVLTQGSTRFYTRLKGRDGRRWVPGSVTVAARLRVPASAPVGTYELGLWMPDAASKVFNDPRYAIQLANVGTWNATTGPVGSLTLSQGGSFRSATGAILSACPGRRASVPSWSRRRR